MRFTSQEKLHLTVLFLGSVEEEQRASLISEIQSFRTSCPKFRLQLTACGAFPEHGGIAVAWVGVSSAPELSLCRCEALALARTANVEPADLRDYHPHITIGRRKGRLKSGHARAALAAAAVRPLEFEASRLVLFHSKTDSTGHRYEVVQALDFI